MKEFWIKICNKLKNPPAWGKALSFLVTMVSAIAALCMLLVDYEGNDLAIVAYSLFGIAGVSLAYSIYLFVLIAPNIKNYCIDLLESNGFTHRMLRNFGFRTVVFAIVSFVMSLVFSAFNAYMGIMNRSIWYGALAAYYIALAFLRGGILNYHKSKLGKSKNENFQSQFLQKAKVYRNSGIVLLILNVALSSAIVQMIFVSAHFSYVGLTIFAYAAYAFYKIIMSVINLVRAKKQEDLTVQAIRNVNLADATVSILALQTALLTTFNDGSVNISVMNTVTGIIVSAFSIALGIYMIVSATKKIKEIKSQKEQKEILDNE